MSEPVELYCTYDEDHNTWLVYFTHSLGGIHVLETFDNETDARAFHQDQIDSAEI